MYQNLYQNLIHIQKYMLKLAFSFIKKNKQNIKDNILLAKVRTIIGLIPQDRSELTFPTPGLVLLFPKSVQLTTSISDITIMYHHCLPDLCSFVFYLFILAKVFFCLFKEIQASVFNSTVISFYTENVCSESKSSKGKREISLTSICT